jgi:hypothetical protein
MDIVFWMAAIWRNFSQQPKRFNRDLGDGAVIVKLAEHKRPTVRACAGVAMWRDRVDTLYARYPAPTRRREASARGHLKRLFC